MKCPHCLESFHEQLRSVNVAAIAPKAWYARWQVCPACDKIIIKLGYYLSDCPGFDVSTERFVEPKAMSRSPLPKEIPDKFANDYKEACLILTDSPKASAAISRRCLQNVLREKAQIKKDDLSKEIDQVLASKQLPSHLAESIDAIRNIGNFGAHPIKSKNTGEIVDVEPGEAEWTLDVLEGLFDFYFVQPEILAKKRAALNKKLKNAGKPPMK